MRLSVGECFKYFSSTTNSFMSLLISFTNSYGAAAYVSWSWTVPAASVIPWLAKFMISPLSFVGLTSIEL